MTEFPTLENVFRNIIDSFQNSDNKFVRDHGQFLIAKSTTARLHSLFLQCIEPEIFYLEGKIVDVNLLLEIRDKQISRAETATHLFEGAGGYLNFLTDKRNSSYLKFYVGQSNNLLLRIHEHCLRLTRKDVSTLH